MKYTIALLLATVLVAGCAAGPPRQESNEPLERYLAYAGEPVPHFTSFRLHSWESLSRNRLVLWNGVKEAYLVTIWDTCPDLQFVQRIRVISTGYAISTFDKIRVGRDSCPIREIRPIDVPRMKADRAAAKAGAGKAAGED